MNEEQLKWFANDLQACIGVAPERFLCPILLYDDPKAELCDGHVLNAAIKECSRLKVIQRKDVDNYFGRTIEPDLIKYLNIPKMASDEFVDKADTAAVVSGDERFPVIAAAPNQKNLAEMGKRFPRFSINGPTNSFPHRFVKIAIEGFDLTRPVQLEASIVLAEPALIGSFLKCAYLAMFRIAGYRWVGNPSADFVRRPLARFFEERASKEQAGEYFGPFRGCVKIVLNDSLIPLGDTLTSKWFLLHYADRFDPEFRGHPVFERSQEMLFAVSLLFRINGLTFVATLPSYIAAGDYLPALSRYVTYLKEPRMPHTVKAAHFEDGGSHDPFWKIYDIALPMHFEDRSPRVG